MHRLAGESAAGAVTNRPERDPGDAMRESRTGFDLMTLFAARWRLLIGLPLLVALSAGAFSLLLPRRFTVESRFVPESQGSGASRLAGLAAQFGVPLPGSEGSESIDFYTELLESGDLLRSLTLTEFTFPVDEGHDTLSGNLVELLEEPGTTPERREKNAVAEVADLITARADPGANIVTVSTSAPWPALAVQMNERLLALLTEFNVERRQSRAAAERRFLQERLEEAQNDLREAEAALERFLSRNRLYSESPQLNFEHSRLQRQVDLRQAIYTSLAQGFEQARVDEVRNTPVITVIDHPRGPANQTSPNLIVNAVLGGLLGLLLAVAYVVGSAFLDSARRRDPAGYQRLRASLPGLRRRAGPSEV